MRFIKLQLFLIIIAFLGGMLVSDFTELQFKKTASKLMNAIAGNGFRIVQLNNKGVPKVFYTSRDKPFDNPVYTSVYALDYFSEYKNTRENDYFLSEYLIDINHSKLSNEQERERFLNCAKWLHDNLVLKSSGKIKYGLWYYDFDWPIYNLKPKWASGMAQGLGIQVLIRAYSITHDKSYLEYAKYALNSFQIETANGGVTIKDSADSWWYEEYAGGKTAKRSRVLNGAMHTVIGIYEYRKLTGDTDAKQLFDKGINSIKSNIGKYDAGWWTYYDSLGLLANKKYHIVHVELTKKLYDLTGQRIFLRYHKKWSSYNSPFISREFLRQKPNFLDITIWGLNSLFVFLFGNIALFAFTKLRKRSMSK